MIMTFDDSGNTIKNMGTHVQTFRGLYNIS